MLKVSLNRMSISRWARPLLLAGSAAVVLSASAVAAQSAPAAASPAKTAPAQAPAPSGGGAGGGAGGGGVWELFIQSFDVFTILLVLGSVAAVAVILAAVARVRAGVILPEATVGRIQDLARAGRHDELRDAVNRDDSFVSRVLRAAMLRKGSREAMREAGELAAAEEAARWFRMIEPLNVIGNLGPLIGLAGTVWGMILAFNSLGETAGQAGPTDLSLGISKALFHTLLGLCLAIPCLLTFGLYRSVVDRHCTRGVAIASDVIDRLSEPRPETESTKA
jgi:biopolymer transport protein ExbB